MLLCEFDFFHGDAILHDQTHFFNREIKHLFDDPLIEFLGEVDEQQKRHLLAGAYALVFPIDWPEPFGLVMIEAMACGTPVIAYNRGSVAEIIDDGLTGFVVLLYQEDG